MEKQKATFKVFSHKTGGVCLDLGDGEAWYELTEKVKDYVEGCNATQRCWLLWMRIETYPLSNQRVCKRTMARVWKECLV